MIHLTTIHLTLLILFIKLHQCSCFTFLSNRNNACHYTGSCYRISSALSSSSSKLSLYPLLTKWHQQQSQQQRSSSHKSWNSIDRTLNNLFVLYDMKRPILDQIASTLFRLENERVESSSVIDDKGRYGEPMEWSKKESYANKLSELIASNPIGYQLKQFVANVIAGNDYNTTATQDKIQTLIDTNDIIMFSFTTCPFCRKAKDILDEQNVIYNVLELDTLLNSEGNEIRAELGKITKRTSVPSIFINQIYIGGCNDGNPGLIKLIQSGEFHKMMTINNKS